MFHKKSLLAVLFLATLLSCAYYNTFYNARKSYNQAMDLARQNPDRPVSTEEQLLNDAITGAAKVLSVYPQSRWADDAQLLLGDAFLQSGRRTLSGSGTSDFKEAMMAYSSAIVLTEDREIRDRANIGLGLAAMELHRYNDAEASLLAVTPRDHRLYFRSRLYLMQAYLQDQKPTEALSLADSLETPHDDSLAAELTLLKGKAYIEFGLPDSGAVLALAAGEEFGRGEGYYRALTTAAEAYLLQERPDMAVSILNRLLAGYRSDMETAAIALLNGKAKELSDDVSGALLSYRTAADMDRYREYGAEALYRRALLLESQDRVEDAITDLEELSGRSGDYLWIRLASDRLKDLTLLRDYEEELDESGQDPWMWRLMIAEKRMDLYGNDDSLAMSELLDISSEGPDMERALALMELADLLPISADSAGSMIMEAYGLSAGGDLATVIEDRMDLTRGASYSQRPSVVLERAWDLVDRGDYQMAWDMLDQVLKSPWSRMIRPRILWAAYVAGEGARVDDGVLEDYLTELVDDYSATEYGIWAKNRLTGGESQE